MLRFLILEVVLPILLLTFLRAVIRSIFQNLQGSSRTPQPRPAAAPSPVVQAGGELKKDPVCGTYVSTAVSVTRRVNGELVHFCSPACRDKYHAA